MAENTAIRGNFALVRPAFCERRGFPDAGKVGGLEANVCAVRFPSDNNPVGGLAVSGARPRIRVLCRDGAE
jgi:hypothetical protein